MPPAALMRSVQGRDEIVIKASPETIWRILTDTARLPEWAPMVKHTNGTQETLDAVRQCGVEFDGRRGHWSRRHRGRSRRRSGLLRRLTARA